MVSELPITSPAPGAGDRLGHLVVRFPQILPVLHRHHLDFCCGGNVPVAEACAERGLDPKDLLSEFDQAIAQGDAGARWDERPIHELLEHIVTRFHEAHRAQLPLLVEMARKVESVHADKPSAPHGLADALESWVPELIQHMHKEEQVLFPMIESGRGSFAGPPIQVMESEHRDHGRNLERVRKLAHDYEPPAEACTTWRALYSGLAAFERDLLEHVHLENHVLFPRALHGEIVKDSGAA